MKVSALHLLSRLLQYYPSHCAHCSLSLSLSLSLCLSSINSQHWVPCTVLFSLGAAPRGGQCKGKQSPAPKIQPSGIPSCMHSHSYRHRMRVVLAKIFCGRYRHLPTLACCRSLSTRRDAKSLGARKRPAHPLPACAPSLLLRFFVESLERFTDFGWLF